MQPGNQDGSGQARAKQTCRKARVQGGKEKGDTATRARQEPKRAHNKPSHKARNREHTACQAKTQPSEGRDTLQVDVFKDILRDLRGPPCCNAQQYCAADHATACPRGCASATSIEPNHPCTLGIWSSSSTETIHWARKAKAVSTGALVNQLNLPSN